MTSPLDTFWNLWVIAIVVGSLVGCGLLIQFSRKTEVHSEETDETTGHEYDGIQELDNPMPHWWVMMFWGTIVFAFIYIFIYGLANIPGFLQVEVEEGKTEPWTQIGQYREEVQLFDAQIAPYFAEAAAVSVVDLATARDADGNLVHADKLESGKRLFLNNCAVCHGSGAKGAQGFPNLTDHDWLYGGAAEQIVETITNGRAGVMPPKGLMPQMTDEQLTDVVAYVRSLSGLKHDEAQAAAGAPVFAAACAACHGADGTGMYATGAPNLTDNVWLYGGSTKQIDFTIRNGRNGRMPAQKDRLSSEKIHLLAAYVYSLSAGEQVAE